MDIFTNFLLNNSKIINTHEQFMKKRDTKQCFEL